MPNFTHGTAGVAYFLAALYEATGSARFLEAAMAGADQLKAIAETHSGDCCLIFHHEDVGSLKGTHRHYLGFCQGPPGTSRLFERLFMVTGDMEWRRWVERCSEAVLRSGIPEVRTEGFWNNVGQCCGSAGIIDHFVDQYRLFGDHRFLEFAQRLADNLLQRALQSDDGLKWIQAEHRTQPKLLEAQTGYMQGAAGIACSLLNLESVARGMDSKRLRFVDDPWFRTLL